MKRISGWAIGAVAVAAGFGLVLAGGDDASVFVDAKCSMCHSVSSAKIEATTKAEAMKGPDLTGVTTRRDPEWIGKYVRKEIDLDGKQHKTAFKGTDDELSKLVAWLGTQTGQ